MSGVLTLARLADALGPQTIDLLRAPRGADVSITGPRIYDPMDPGGIGPGDLVLAVNLDPSAADARAALEEAARAGAVAIAFKGDHRLLVDTLGPTTDEHGLALIRVAATMSWDQVHALARNAAATVADAPDGDRTTPLGDLFALANALAGAIGGAVTIEGARSTLLAYSNLDQPIDDARRETILGRRTPGNWTARLEEEGIVRKLLASPGTAVPIHDPLGQARDRVAICVAAGAEIVGSIWVVEGDRPLHARAAELLEEAAPLAALHLLQHRNAEDLARSNRSALVKALLDGERPAREVAAALGIDEAGACGVVCFHVPGDDDLDVAVKRAMVVDRIVLACEAFRRRVICADTGRRVYALFPSMNPTGVARLEALVADIARDASESLGVRVVAGIGATVAGLRDAADSRRDADRAVRVLVQSDERTAAVHVDDIRVQSILLELGDVVAGRPDLALPALGVLARHDREHAKPYVETLRAMALSSWDISAAARDLGVHANTLRYRLKRIEEISGLKLDNASDRLVLSLYCVTGNHGV